MVERRTRPLSVGALALRQRVEESLDARENTHEHPSSESRAEVFSKAREAQDLQEQVPPPFGGEGRERDTPDQHADWHGSKDPQKHV